MLERGENHAPRHSHHRRVVAEGMNVENVRVRHGTDRKGRAQGSPVDEGRLRPEGASPVEERVRRPHAREAFAFAAFVEAVVEMFPVRREDALSFRLHLFARAAHEGFGRVVPRHRGGEFREVPGITRHASRFVETDLDHAEIAGRAPRLHDERFIPVRVLNDGRIGAFGIRMVAEHAVRVAANDHVDIGDGASEFDVRLVAHVGEGDDVRNSFLFERPDRLSQCRGAVFEGRGGAGGRDFLSFVVRESHDADPHAAHGLHDVGLERRLAHRTLRVREDVRSDDGHREVLDVTHRLRAARVKLVISERHGVPGHALHRGKRPLGSARSKEVRSLPEVPRVEREHGRIFLSQGFDRLHDAGVAARAGVVLAAGGVAAVDPGRGRVRVVGVHDREFEAGSGERTRKKRGE